MRYGFPGFPGRILKFSPRNHCKNHREHGPQGVTSFLAFFSATNLRIEIHPLQKNWLKFQIIRVFRIYPENRFRAEPITTNNLDIHESNLNRVRSSHLHRLFQDTFVSKFASVTWVAPCRHEEILGVNSLYSSKRGTSRLQFTSWRFQPI